MPITRSQTKDKKVVESSATDAAPPALHARRLTPKKRNVPSPHPGGKHCTSETETQSKEKKAISEQSYCGTCFTFVAVLIVVVVLGVVMIEQGKTSLEGSQGKQSVRNSNMAAVEKNVSSIQKNFPEQVEDLWETIKATVDYYLSTEPNPECPIILLFGSRSDASKTSRCLVEKLGRILSQVLSKQSPADSLHEIDGKVFQKQNADQAKMDMDRGLRKAFQGKPGKKVATIFNLDHLPPCSVLLFHGYCDTDNAIFKDVAMMFTVTLDDRSPWPNSPKDWEPLVMDHLRKLWVDKCPSLPSEKVEAFLSRITNNVLFVRREESPKC